MKTLKVIGNICLVFLAIISVCVSLAFCYYHFFVDKKVIGVNYINDQVPKDFENAKDLSDEQINYYEDRVLFHVNYYSNSKKNGIELQEMQLNYFTDISLNMSACRSTGMQYLGNFKNYTVDESDVGSAGEYIVPDFYYYDTTDMISWDGGRVATLLNRNTMFTIKIDNKPYLLQLTGKKEYKSKFLWWEWVSKTIYYDFGTVFADALHSVETNSKGYGDFYITLNLSEYFTIYAYDENTKNWSADNISDKVFTYAVMKFHYDENGARNSTQSLFNIIQCNPNYGLSSDIDTTYWQERMVYNLTAKDFVYRYSDTYKGYFASLDLDTKKIFAEMPRAKVNITLDFQSQYLKDNKINIVGLDYNALENFEIDTLTITGENQTFYLLEKSLYNTKLQTLKHSKGITLDVGTNAINNEYVGVEL